MGGWLLAGALGEPVGLFFARPLVPLLEHNYSGELELVGRSGSIDALEIRFP